MEGTLSAVEVVRSAHRAYESISRGGEPGALIALLHDDVEWEMGPTGPDERFQGWDGVMRWVREFVDAFDYVEVDALDLDEVADGVVLGRIVVRGRGAASGLEVDRELHEVILVEDGRIRWRKGYASGAEAEAAAARHRAP